MKNTKKHSSWARSSSESSVSPASYCFVERSVQQTEEAETAVELAEVIADYSPTGRPQGQYGTAFFREGMSYVLAQAYPV